MQRLLIAWYWLLGCFLPSRQITGKLVHLLIVNVRTLEGTSSVSQTNEVDDFFEMTIELDQALSHTAIAESCAWDLQVAEPRTWNYR